MESSKPRNFSIVKLNFDDFYENGTKPEGAIFTFSKRFEDKSLSSTWKIAHWEEIINLLTGKYYLSERLGSNCGLIKSARDYFNQKENILRLADLVSMFDLSLPELSLVIKEGEQRRIFVPNLSISNAKSGILRPHETFEDFFNSDSYNLIRLIVQYGSANPDFNLPHSQLTERFNSWVEKYGKEARRRLRQSLEFDKNKMYVEGISPDEVLKELGHLLYEDIAGEVVLKKSLENTIV